MSAAITDPPRCPHCGSTALTAGPVGNADLPDGWRRIWCRACRWASARPDAPTRGPQPAARK